MRLDGIDAGGGDPNTAVLELENALGDQPITLADELPVALKRGEDELGVADEDKVEGYGVEQRSVEAGLRPVEQQMIDYAGA